MDENELLKRRIEAKYPLWDSYTAHEKEIIILKTQKTLRYDRADRAMMRAQRTLDGYTNKSA